MSAKRLQVPWNPPEHCSASVFYQKEGALLLAPLL